MLYFKPVNMVLFRLIWNIYLIRKSCNDLSILSDEQITKAFLKLHDGLISREIFNNPAIFERIDKKVLEKISK